MYKKKFLSVFVVLGLVFTFIYPETRANSIRIQNPANGHYYQRIDTKMTWYEAKKACESLGGYLATIASQDENDFIYGNLGLPGESHWLGGTDKAEEGVWEWIISEPWSYTNWAPGEPNNFAGKEHYLSFMDNHPYQWNDLDNNGGSNVTSLICEWEIALNLDIIYSPSWVKRGDLLQWKIALTNEGNSVVNIDQVRVDIDGLVTHSISLWTGFRTLDPGQRKEIWLKLRVPMPTPVGLYICTTVAEYEDIDLSWDSFECEVIK